MIFRAKTKEAYNIKILAELLSNNIKTGCFEIDSKGIRLRMMDAHRKILIDLNLLADNFIVYKFKKTTKLFVGINLNHFHKMLKSIKKKDIVELFIEDGSNDLSIKVIPKENNRVTISCIKIQNIQNISIDLPENTIKPIIIASSEYQKMIKDLGNIGNVMSIKSTKSNISFSCNVAGILKRTVQFGEYDDDDDEEDETIFDQTFNTDQLCRITKLSGLSTKIQVFPEKPIAFKSLVGTLGNISIYIKSKEQIENELNNIVEENDDDYDSE